MLHKINKMLHKINLTKEKKSVSTFASKYTRGKLLSMKKKNVKVF